MDGRTFVVLYFCLCLKFSAAILDWTDTYDEPYTLDDIVADEAVSNDPKNNGLFMHKQALDHFHIENDKLWSQLYYVNNKFYKPGGPVFFYVGGEGEIRKPNLDYPLQWVIWAKKTNALMVQLEHRYYGISQPFNNMTTESLKYLTTDQALGDAAMFREFIMQRNNLTSDTKWITFGGSYPGALVVWLRMLYPHLFHGSVASSAPVLASLEFSDYLRTTEKDIAKYCPAAIPMLKSVFKTINSMLDKRSSTILKKTFHLCDDFDLNNEFDRHALVQQIIGPIETEAQYGFIPYICGKFTNESLGTPLEKLVYALEKSNLDQGFNCTRSYNMLVEHFSQTSTEQWNGPVGLRQWIYQTCTEYGWFTTTRAGGEQLFDFDLKLKYPINLCNDVFKLNTSESTLGEAVVTHNILKGGRRPQVSNVIFVNGLDDPWHTLSVTERYSDDIETVIIKDGSHCKDMSPSSFSDSEDLKNKREEIFNYIQKILKKPQ